MLPYHSTKRTQIRKTQKATVHWFMAQGRGKWGRKLSCRHERLQAEERGQEKPPATRGSFRALTKLSAHDYLCCWKLSRPSCLSSLPLTSPSSLLLRLHPSCLLFFPSHSSSRSLPLLSSSQLPPTLPTTSIVPLRLSHHSQRLRTLFPALPPSHFLAPFPSPPTRLLLPFAAPPLAHSLKKCDIKNKTSDKITGKRKTFR